MNPVAVTFVDEKFLPYANEQKKNFNSFGVDHVSINISNKKYNMMLWMDLIDLTIEAIEKYGKIFRVDAEIRIHKPLPESWIQSDNVLFFIEPIYKQPWYVAINTGHMILSKSAIPFLECLKTITMALVPPDYNGELLSFDDEDLTSPALAVTKIPYLREVIDYSRSDTSIATCTRGDWVTTHTVITHPCIHNWNTVGHTITDYLVFRNHFAPTESVKIADGALLGMKNKVSASGYWKSLGFAPHGVYWKRDEWLIHPPTGSFSHLDFDSFKQPYQP